MKISYSSVIGNAILLIDKPILTKREIYKYWNIVDKLLPDGFYTESYPNAFENFCDEYSFLVKRNSNSIYILDENKKNIDIRFRIGINKEILDVFKKASEIFKKEKKMEFVVKNNNCLDRYEITYNEEELNKLRLEVINECSKIEHNHFRATRGIYPNRNINDKDYDLKYRNYTEKYIGMSESRDELQYPSDAMYEYDYDNYIFPHLVMIIDEIKNGKISYVKELFDDKKRYDGKSYSDRIDELSEKIDLIDNKNVDLKIKKLEELKELINESKSNKNKKDIYEYYKKVRDLMNINYIESINLDTVNLVNNFFSEKLEYEKYIDKDCDNILKYYKRNI